MHRQVISVFHTAFFQIDQACLCEILNILQDKSCCFGVNELHCTFSNFNTFACMFGIEIYFDSFKIL